MGTDLRYIEKYHEGMQPGWNGKSREEESMQVDRAVRFILEFCFLNFAHIPFLLSRGFFLHVIDLFVTQKKYSSWLLFFVPPAGLVEALS